MYCTHTSANNPCFGPETYRTMSVKKASTLKQKTHHISHQFSTECEIVTENELRLSTKGLSADFGYFVNSL